MELEEIPNNDNRYVFLLKITSEEDLLETDEATGEKNYTPVTMEDVIRFKREAEHLSKEIYHAIEVFKWKISERKSLAHYFRIYQELAEKLEAFLQYIHSLHRKVYRTIYKTFNDELMDIYTKVLEKGLNEIQLIAKKHADYFQNVDADEQNSGAHVFSCSVRSRELRLILIFRTLNLAIRTMSLPD